MTRSAFEGYEHTKDHADHIKKQIADLEKRIKKIEEEGAVKDSVTGGMGGREHFKIEGFPVTEYERFLCTYRERKKTYENMLWEMENQINEIQEIMKSVSDPFLKLIIQYRVIDGRSWDSVASKIGTTIDSVKHTYFRFLEKQKNIV